MTRRTWTDIILLAAIVLIVVVLMAVMWSALTV